MMTHAHGRLPTLGEITKQLLGRARGETRRRGGLHVTKQPVRGGSKEAGSSHEEAFMVRLDDSARRACRRAVNEAFERGRRLRLEVRAKPRELTRFEEQCTRITNSAIRVYEALLRMEKLFRGRVHPSYEMIAEWATVSRTTVARAIEALSQIGLLAKLRRYVHTYDKVLGARSEQTSNAYRLELPRLLHELIERRLRPAPIPQDEAQRQHERLADHAAMLSGLNQADYIRATTGDAELAKTLIGLLNAIEKRDEHRA